MTVCTFVRVVMIMMMLFYCCAEIDRRKQGEHESLQESYQQFKQTHEDDESDRENRNTKTKAGAHFSEDEDQAEEG